MPKGRGLSEAIKGLSGSGGRPDSTRLLSCAFMSTSNPSAFQLRDFSLQDSILLVGEGDFSFARSLVAALTNGEISARKVNLVATSFDSLADLCAKYGSTPQKHVNALLKTPGVSVLHSVDARKLHFESRLAGRSFSRIAFNFPHLGGASEEDIAKNQNLVRDFLHSAAWMLPQKEKHSSNRIPQVLVTLRQTAFYERWAVPTLCDDKRESETDSCQPRLKYAGTFPFQDEIFASFGYGPKRTHPSMRGAPTADNAQVFVFTRVFHEGGKGGERESAAEKRSSSASVSPTSLPTKGKKAKKTNTAGASRKAEKNSEDPRKVLKDYPKGGKQKKGVIKGEGGGQKSTKVPKQKKMKNIKTTETTKTGDGAVSLAELLGLE
uniref:25S rRNA (uridine-N(3))-methyltransferase BMT5-like domain-containing protein n=1 Tax=Chromera velia CCMP2878 TaxID=1169474 RepID=A0A0G4HYB9_9ALVE|eukprot:Cvel_9457.t1-p1 / transcript=Cvel_9457.t1 / gene=Cvel_9457 / organism=Chromera_velia_CCMP2878 / gene_product=Uncharacterized protein At4g26485, putative / transcript_product=Uncharacterized protein At4g26485, putative / location=Cvel_scaffold545:71861-73791(+) / protein_length=378 / sequence_SO=supercontig / SO=protein_coding / is_pseudo=false